MRAAEPGFCQGLAEDGQYRQGEYLSDRHTASLGLRPDPRGVLQKEEMPAHTLMAVTALAAPEFLIEIEAIAVL